MCKSTSEFDSSHRPGERAVEIAQRLFGRATVLPRIGFLGGGVDRLLVIDVRLWLATYVTAGLVSLGKKW